MPLIHVDLLVASGLIRIKRVKHQLTFRLSLFRVLVLF
jgi:hypothetical protein